MKQATEDILIKALKLQEEGKTPEHIFAAFPEAREDLKKYFDLSADLHAAGRNIAPPSREVLHSALRRAAAMREVSAMPGQLNFLSRLPGSLRILVPMLAVLVIAALVDLSPVAAPAPVQLIESPAGDSTDQSLESISLQQQAPGNNSSASETFMSQAPSISQRTAKTVPPSAGPVAAMSVDTSETGSSMPPSTPREAANRISQEYISNAQSEEGIFADTSIEEQAVRSGSKSELSSYWANQDNERMIEREELVRIQGAYSRHLGESSAAGAFKASVESASKERQLAFDVANKNFRRNVLDLFEAYPPSANEFSKLAAQYQADLRSIAADFEAEISSARKTFGEGV